MGKHYRQKSTEEKLIHWIIIGFMGVGLLAWVWPFLLAGGIGFGIYKFASRQASLAQSQATLRLQQLKDNIGRTDRQLKLLEEYQANGNEQQYVLLSRQLLPQLKSIQSEADLLQSKMGQHIYQRISTKVTQVTADIRAQLDQLEVKDKPTPLSKEEEQVQTLAPELLTCYHNIKADDQIIREKIKLSDNRAELAALHAANMNRFEDILQGYLKIKAAPKDFHKAEERLQQAKAALEQFDLQLDETLRELNEDDLSDFEVSLRLMSKKETGYEA